MLWLWLTIIYLYLVGMGWVALLIENSPIYARDGGRCRACEWGVRIAWPILLPYGFIAAFIDAVKKDV